MNEDLWMLTLSPLMVLWVAGVVGLGLFATRDAHLQAWRRKLARPLLPCALVVGGTRLAGMVAGGLLYLIIGGVTHAHLPWPERLAGGVVNGYLYGWLWSIGTGTVAAVMWENHTRKRRQEIREPLSDVTVETVAKAP